MTQFSTLVLAAEQAPPASDKPSGGGSEMFIMMAVIAAAFYFIILRPQKKEQKKREELLSQLKKGDQVVSAGGIHGTVVDVSRPDVAVVEVDAKRGVRLTFNRTSISVINPDKSGKPAEAPADDKSDKQSKDK